MGEVQVADVVVVYLADVVLADVEEEVVVVASSLVVVADFDIAEVVASFQQEVAAAVGVVYSYS